MPQKILLVDDTDANLILIKAYLKNFPIELETAENGKIALEKYIAGTFNLVLMDMQMPIMNGLEATKKIRSWEVLNQKTPTPIIALTGNAFKEDGVLSLEAGCDIHLSKPVKKSTLLEYISIYSKPN